MSATSVGLDRPMDEAIAVEPWPSEGPLFAFSIIAAIGIWIVATISIVGLFYALILLAFFWTTHLIFIAHVRGSGIRLGPDQFPALYARVEHISRRMGLVRVPEVYLLQASGALNALATRFLRSNIVVLFSDFLDACGENAAARDMIIGHELGHIRSGHLVWEWLVIPAKLVPFLGMALSRAREYTCDRFGLAAAGDREGAMLGLTILSAGGRQGPQVNREAVVRQTPALETGWMTIGEWLSTHPPLAKRLLALDPRLAVGPHKGGALRALAILAGLVVVFFSLGAAGVMTLSRWNRSLQASADSVAKAQEGLKQLAAFLDGERTAGRELPKDGDELLQRWMAVHPGQAMPVDPYDGAFFGYRNTSRDAYILFSSGPDGRAGTADDIVVGSMAR